MIIGCPSGIGDFSWAWSKLYAMRNRIDAILIADGWPYRTTPYVELCWSPEERAEARRTHVPTDPEHERVRFANGAGYGTFNYKEIQMYEWATQLATIPGYSPTWADVLHRSDGAAEVLLQPNAHLEAGRQLDSWLADLPTTYHYPLYTSRTAARYAAETTGNLRVTSKLGHNVPLVGISCASYRGSEAWKTWDSDAWVAFLTEVMRLGWQPIILGGNWDDLSSNVAARLGLPDLVGRTSVEQMVEILCRLDAYIGFSSGLGVVRTVLNKPALSLWPDFQKELSTAWAPPDMLASGRYVAAPYRDPIKDVLPVATRFLTLCAEEAANGQEAQRQAWEKEKVLA